MRSDVSFTYTRPVAFTPELGAKIVEILRKYHDRLVAAYVLEAGQNPADISTPQQAEDRYIAGGRTDNKLSDLRYSLSRMEDFGISVKLNDGTRLKGLELPEVLSLANSGGQQVCVVEAGFGSGLDGASIRFSNEQWGRDCEVSFRGVFDIGQNFRTEVILLLSSFTQPWWFFKRLKYMVLLSFPFASVYLLSKLTTSRPLTADLFVQPPAILAGLVGSLVGVVALYGIDKGWNWAFPSVEFVFGGGIQRNSIKGLIRKSLFSVPFLSFVVPIVVNKLS